MGDGQSQGCDVLAPATVEPVGSALCEPTLLSQLVQLLGNREGHSLLLSDLGALLPGHLRHGVKERGGLRSWLQKYPELFMVSGQPGKESVALLLGVAKAKREEVNECPTEREDGDSQCAVQLRGLPYRATVTDIKQFLGHNVNMLKDDHAVQLVLNRDGRPSGFARVQFNSPLAARAARDELHMHNIGHTERYVEMFLYSERPNKSRKAVKEDDEVSTKEQVVKECREHMSSPGKGQLLLSMLGVALSSASRLYLKRTNQGLKHFLVQYPEFSVEGAKGRECVMYLPAIEKHESSPCEHIPSENVQEPQSPHVMPATPKIPKTPSDWGTPLGWDRERETDWSWSQPPFWPSWPAAVASGSWAENLKTAASGASVRLRGLPCDVSEQDVLAFFAKFDVVEHIAEQARAVELANGQAIVHMQSLDSAEEACQVLDGKCIGALTIEVCLCEAPSHESAAAVNAGSQQTLNGILSSARGSSWEQRPLAPRDAPKEEAENSWVALWDFLNRDEIGAQPDVLGG